MTMEMIGAMEVSGVKLSRRTVAYLDTILWAETVLLPVTEDELVDGRMDVDDQHPLHGIHEQDSLDDHFDIHDFDAESLRVAERDCSAFFARLEELDLLERANEHEDDDQIARDFWFTRVGHGVGFFDGDYDDPDDDVDDLGEALSDVAAEFNDQYVWANDGGKLEIEGQ
jgi:hypothetical protein